MKTTNTTDERRRVGCNVQIRALARHGRAIGWLFLGLLMVLFQLSCSNDDEQELGPKLRSLTIEPSVLTLRAGSAVQLVARAGYSDGSHAVVSSLVEWSSDRPSVAVFRGPPGSVSAVSIGSARVSAKLLDQTARSNVSVKEPATTLLAIEVRPSNASIALGTSEFFSATGIYSDASKQDLTAQVTWASSAIRIATISNANHRQGQATSQAVGITTITASFGKVSSTVSLNVTNAALASIELTPNAPTIALGTAQSFAATGVYSDGTRQDLTSAVNWSCSNEAVATISNHANTRGLASSSGVGSASIVATLEGVSSSTTLTVSDAVLKSIEISPNAPEIALGTAQAFVATGIYGDASKQDLTAQVTWSSSSETTATVSNAAGTPGVATSHDVGVASISATFGGLKGSTNLSVSRAVLDAIEVTPNAPSLALGSTRVLNATGIYSDGSRQNLTSQVTWASSREDVATVTNAWSSEGLATSVSVGSTTVSATLAGITGSTILSVSDAELTKIELTPATASIALGSTLGFTATGVYSDASRQDLTTQATWSSSAKEIATVSNASGSHGLATPVGLGVTRISASFGALSGSIELTVKGATLVAVEVNPQLPSIALGTSLNLLAMGIFSDGSRQDLSTQAVWASSAGSVASVSNASGTQGLASARASGSSWISASVGDVSAATKLTVSDAALEAIEITPFAASIALATRRRLRATGIYADGLKQDLTTLVTWTSSADASVAISNARATQGVVTALELGTATIRASLGDVMGAAALTVTGAALTAIEVTPHDSTLALDTFRTLTATGVYADSSRQDLSDQVIWHSSAVSVARISNATDSEGLVWALGPGATTISASFANSVGSSTLSVNPGELEQLDVLPVDPSGPLGVPTRFQALGSFSDGSVQDVSARVTWSSTDPTVATISNAPGSEGLCVPLSLGSTNIVANWSTVSDFSLLDVTDAQLVSIALTPRAPSIALGTDLQLMALGTYSDGLEVDLSSLVTWSSSNPEATLVSNVFGGEGLMSGAGSGFVTLSARLGVVSASVEASVSDATLQAIEVSPDARSVATGYALGFRATGSFSDGSTQDLTARVTWSSSSSSVATISNAAENPGWASVLSVGTTVVSATLGNLTGAALLSGTNTSLRSISVSPSSLSLGAHLRQQLTATGAFEDGSLLDLTQQSIWRSSNKRVVSVSTEGLVRAGKKGKVTISASRSACTGSASVTVP